MGMMERSTETTMRVALAVSNVLVMAAKALTMAKLMMMTTSATNTGGDWGSANHDDDPHELPRVVEWFCGWVEWYCLGGAPPRGRVVPS